ncbi:MAG: sugar kinase [Ruminococcus sp.]|nr:sugar kinase [Ruminococcus sp.]
MLKIKESAEFDLVSMGEVMLRFDPGEGRIKNARSFNVWEGGGEYNAARGLRRCFGMKTAVITAFADNEVGRLAEDLILQGGVDVSYIKWLPFDGVGREARNGLNFVERGFGIRGAKSVSDRANTAISKLSAKDVDFDEIFAKTKWFHTGGIYAALSETSAQTALEAVRTAKKHGVIVSFDLNYRASLWKDNGGLTHCREVCREIAKYVDVMIGNEEDFTACLGYKIEGNDGRFSELNLNSYEKMIRKASGDYPNFEVVATTLRTVKSATVNDWSAVLFAEDKLYQGMNFPNLEILDRVGGGDSFASGLIYGLLTGQDFGVALNYGVAHGALAMTTPGDTSFASKAEVEALMSGGGARIVR